MNMSGRSGQGRGMSRRLLPLAAVSILVFAGLALVWSGQAPAWAQDPAKWWGGAAGVDLWNCGESKRDKFFEEVRQDNPTLQSTGNSCGIRLGSSRSDDRDKRASAFLDYAARDEGNRVWLRVDTSRFGDLGSSNEVHRTGWNKLSCADAASIARDVMVAIDAPFGVGSVSCSYNQYAAYADKQVSHQYIDIVFRPGPLRAPEQSCAKDTFLGAWKNDHPKYAMYGAGATFERSMRDGELLGRFSFLRYPEMLPNILASTITTSGPPNGCLFPALRGSSLQHDDALKYDKATDSFTIVYADGSPNPRFPGRWTRGRPAKAAATCSKDDINGTWHRADGARVLMTGVGVFGNGGHGIMDRYPEDRWPKGESKFRAVKEVGVCRYEARCTKVTRRTTNDGSSFDVSDAACTLTVDPAKRVMTESGTGTRVYTRVAPNAAAERAAQAREDAEAAKAREAAAEAERTARLNREVAERDEAIKRRNAEIKAADERRQREYLQALAAQKAEADRIKREAAAARARYEAEMAAWRVRVAACNAGDVSQCQ